MALLHPPGKDLARAARAAVAAGPGAAAGFFPPEMSPLVRTSLALALFLAGLALFAAAYLFASDLRSGLRALRRAWDRWRSRRGERR